MTLDHPRDVGAFREMTNTLEARTQRYGREIFARLDRDGPMPFTPAWLDDKLMDLTMGEPAMKVQLFRFIDALPLLNTPESISSHLREYLQEAEEHLPWFAKFGLRVMPSKGWAGRLLAWAARRNAEHLAHRFIAGSDIASALKSVARLRQLQMGFTVDLLGEATITESEAEAVQAQYLELINELTREVNTWPEVPRIDRDHLGPIPRVNVSVKLSALYSQFDPIDPAGTSRAVRARLRPILHAAREQGAFVNFDMEQHSFKDVTLQIFEEILSEEAFRDWADVGIAIQAYLRETEADLDRLLNWAQQRGVGVWIRLVKGAYWDYETVIAAQNGWPVPVYTDKAETDACFERCARLLMENYRHLRPAFASHNVRSIAAAMALAEELGVPQGAYEFQMLYGMADPIKEVLNSLGYRLRIYTPYGQLLPGMAYLVRRLLENTSNESFLRASFSEHVPEEFLLMNPTIQKTEDGELTPGAGFWEAGALRSGATDPSDRRAIHEFRNEPMADFSVAANREAMRQALADGKIKLARSWLAIIDGEKQDGAGTIKSVNPSRKSQLVGKVASASADQAREAIAAATRAFPAWRDTPPEERAGFLFKIAEIFRRRRFELAAWEVYECAKPWREADGDVCEAIDFCEYYAREMLRFAEPQRVDLPGEENSLFYEPRGVAVVIAPWNFPLAILCGMTTAALVAGNTVIMKPAEQSSVIGAVFMEVIQEAGVPPGVLHFLPGIGEEVGPVLVNHPDVAVIAFTGSLGVGTLITEQAAKVQSGQTHIKEVITELGGKNAIIVDDDADLDEAVKGVAESAFVYAGQKCSACSRAIVLESIYDQFLARLIETTKSLTIAGAEDPGCSVPPVIDAEARDRIGKAIDKGKSEARLAFAGNLGKLADEGFFVAPHVFAEVPPDSSLAQEEIFGPVLAVIKARDLDHALEIANGTKYALTGGVFSRSPKNIDLVRRRFRVGNLYVNRKCTGALVQRQPFGGFKLSGVGSKAGGPDYLLQFMIPRAICENTLRRGFAPEVGGM